MTRGFCFSLYVFQNLIVQKRFWLRRNVWMGRSYVTKIIHTFSALSSPLTDA